MAPTTMKAIVVTERGKVALQDVPVPTPLPNEVLVKVVAAAQNPTDWKHIDYGGFVGAFVGCDFAGTIEAIGCGVPAGDFKVGDRVASCVHGGVHPGRGSFAEYLVAFYGLLMHIPESMSYEEASGLGAACVTTCQMFYQSQSLPSPLEPAEKPFPILIWSGASGVGQLLIQWGHLSGLEVITTASPRHHEYLKSLGASMCLDYNDPDAGQKIHDATKGALASVMDCNGSPEGMVQIGRAIGESGGTISIITTPTDYHIARADVKIVHSLAYTLLPLALKFPVKASVNVEHVEAGKRYAKLVSEVLAKYSLKVVPPKILPNGLASVEEGLDLHRAGKVSGEKLTYRIADTPGIA